MENINTQLAISIAVIFVLSIILFFLFSSKKQKSKNKKNAKRRKTKLQLNENQQKDFKNKTQEVFSHCDDQQLHDFINYLKEYKGGYIRTQKNKVVFQEFLNYERNLLKTLFYRRIVNSSKIRTETKEDFRFYLEVIGVKGVNERPNYEERDGKLKVKDNLSETDKIIKTVGNYGEKLVRAELAKISNPSTKIINGLQIKTPNNVVIEFDHVIITKQNVFTIETKAFGINQEGIEDNCSIIISDNKDWLKIGKTKIPHKIPSPMKQLQKQHSIMSAILKEFKVVPKNILIIANKNARIKGKIKDNNFSIVTIDNLISTITEECSGKNIKVFEIINKIDSLRIN